MVTTISLEPISREKQRQLQRRWGGSSLTVRGKESVSQVLQHSRFFSQVLRFHTKQGYFDSETLGPEI